MPDPRSPIERVHDACAKYVDAVISAKERTTSAELFWEDSRAAAAYKSLFRALDGYVPKDVRWQIVIWESAHSIADVIRAKKAINRDGVLDEFINEVVSSVDALSAMEWIACVPLERRFSALPGYVDFGPFAVVNARGTRALSQPALFRRFSDLLEKKVGVALRSTARQHSSYEWLADHWYNKTSGYIPGRPTAIIPLARGDAHANERILDDLLAVFGPLLSVCQLEYDLSAATLETRMIGGHSTMPDGKTHMPLGLVKVPSLALAFNKKSGESQLWHTSLRNYETEEGVAYRFKPFMAIWNSTAAPVMEMRKLGAPPKLVDAITNALQLLSRCRHRELGDLRLDSVIAAETILNPYGLRQDMGERFALVAASLCERAPTKRRDMYRIAKKLYQMRNLAVHRALRPTAGDEPTAGDAFTLFIRCFRAICNWVIERLKSRKSCDEPALHEFYLSIIFR